MYTLMWIHCLTWVCLARNCRSSTVTSWWPPVTALIEVLLSAATVDLPKKHWNISAICWPRNNYWIWAEIHSLLAWVGKSQAHTHIPSGSKPSCLHTTMVSFMSHPSLQTLPHTLSLQNSTCPLEEPAPPCSLTSPFSQPLFSSVHIIHSWSYKLHKWVQSNLQIRNTLGTLKVSFIQRYPR